MEEEPNKEGTAKGHNWREVGKKKGREKEGISEEDADGERRRSKQRRGV